MKHRPDESQQSKKVFVKQTKRQRYETCALLREKLQSHEALQTKLKALLNQIKNYGGI